MERPTLSLPTPEKPVTASDFLKSVSQVDNVTRENVAIGLLLGGHVPSWCRNFVEVRAQFKDRDGVQHDLITYQLPDYLTLGTDDDYLHVPLTPIGAQKVADVLECTLPTPMLVTIAWQQAQRVAPQPMGPPYDSTMSTTNEIVVHDARVKAKFVELSIDHFSLVSGHLKDVVLSEQLVSFPTSVAIFGWIQQNGVPIQPLYVHHGNFYADYAHGIRLVSKTCVLDCQQDSIERLYQDKVLSCGVSDEGALTITRYPGT